MIDILLNILMILLLVCAGFILFSKCPSFNIVMLGVFSLVITVIYLILKAPDVAITEVSVGASLSTILLFIAYKRTEPEEDAPINYMNLFPLVVILIAGFYLIMSLPVLGAAENPIHHHVSNYYLANSKIDTGIDSVVTSILAGYRGFDTLGETIVIMLACIGVLNILKKS